MRESTGFAAATLLGAVLACVSTAPPAAQEARTVSGTREVAMNTLTPEERDAGWILLFDGETTNGWRVFRGDEVPRGWRVVDGELTRVARAGDILTIQQFDDFVLELEWKLEPGGNSGVMYRVTEEADRTYKTGPEFQILDDARHVDGASRLTSAGAVYGLYPAPEGVLLPAGEWNHTRIVVDGAHVEHWLNGEQVAAYELWSEDWERRVRESKFVEWPAFGRARSGHIALQDHGDRVAYRNIKLRPLNRDE